MSILNYITIGVIYTFLIDMLNSNKKIKNHPLVKNKEWGWVERILCMIIWPLAILVFLNAFFKSYFKK